MAARARGGSVSTVRQTAAQAVVRYLANQYVVDPAGETRYFAGVWAIFGHGNVAGLGEALQAAQEVLPTYRAHNEQGMAHAAIAFAKQMRRRRAMVCTSLDRPRRHQHGYRGSPGSCEPPSGAVPAWRCVCRPRARSVLQQIENFADGTVSANDCFRRCRAISIES